MSQLFKFQRNYLLYLELIAFSLMLLSLASFEAPKNIFLIFYVGIALIRQLLDKPMTAWRTWDSIFLSIILSAFLSTLFAGLSPGDEWKGFRVLLTFISVAWLLSRSNYSQKEIAWIFWLTILAAIPPLLWGLWEYLILHTKDALQLHSVGHVNHSAIYLTIIFGATLGMTLSSWYKASTMHRACLLALTFLFFISLIIGQSRAAFGIGIVMAALFIWYLTTNKKIKWAGILILLSIIVTTIFLNASIIQKQINNKKDNNVLSGRGAIWNTTLEAAKLYPIFGIGIDNRAFVTKEIIQKSIESRHEIFDESRYDFHFKHSHNFYLTQLAERGVVGFLVTLVFIYLWFRTLFYSFYRQKLIGQSLYLWAGSASAWFVTFGIGFVNTTFHHEHGILACVFLGLHLAFLEQQKKI